MKKILDKFFLLAFSLMISLLLAEGMARLLSKDIKIYQPDPLLDYVFYPNVVVKGSQNKLFLNNVHSNKKGHKIIAEACFNLLKDMLK